MNTNLKDALKQLQQAMAGTTKAELVEAMGAAYDEMSGCEVGPGRMWAEVAHDLLAAAEQVHEADMAALPTTVKP